MNLPRIQDDWVEQDFHVVWRDGERVILRGALQEVDGARCPLLAVLVQEGATHQGFERILCEFRARDHLQANWAVQPHALRESEHALLLRDPGGELLAPLIAPGMSIEDYLEIVIAITEALEQMHGAGILHQDIRPDNILVDRASRRAWFMGFGELATTAGDKGASRNLGERASGSFPYMAPEQTGRMDRQVDFRSDLYAAGVTFYQLLTGHLPFRASDPMEWVHAHLARQPEPPHERRTGVPAQVSRIVMALLAKAAEDRYQTASSLRADLERCLREWRTQHDIAEFAIGRNEASAGLQFRGKLYGRAAELDALHRALDEVIHTGVRRLILVSGYSGAGKTALINEALPHAQRMNCLVARGKLDQYGRDIPYAALAEAFRGLVRDLLGQPDGELSRWREATLQALGANARLIVDLVPELEHLVGQQPPVPPLAGSEARNRFLRVVREFVGVFARPEHPLVLLLDDLQWLDAATLDVFTTLATHPSLGWLAMVGSFRSQHATEKGALTNSLRAARLVEPPPLEIELAGIGLGSATEMIADAMQVAPSEVEELAACVIAKSDDNPFFLLQFLASLEDNGSLAHDARTKRWRWDLDRIRKQEAIGSIVDLMVQRLRGLPPSTLRATQVAACMGNRVDHRKLCAALATDNKAVRHLLHDATKLGLLMKLEDGYAFAHDRVHEAAYAMLAADERADLHLQIARRLAGTAGEDDLDSQLFDVVGQFNRSDPARLPSEDRLLVANLNLRAGRKARQSSAYSEACNHLAMAIGLLEPADRSAHPEFTFDLSLELAECTFLRGDLEQTRTLIEGLLATASTVLQQAAAYRLKVELHVVNSENEAAVEASILALGSLGIPLTAHPGDDEVRTIYGAVQRQFSQRTLNALAELPAMTDPHKLAAMHLLAETWPPAYFTDFNLTVIVICRMVGLSLAHGSTAKSNQGYALLGWLMGPVSGRYKEGYELAAWAAQMAGRSDSAPDFGRTCDTLALTSPWTQPFDTSIDWARQAFATLRDAGDIYFACYSTFHATLALFMRGRGLREESDELKKYLDFASEIGFQDGYALIATYERAVACLRGETRGLTDFTDNAFNGAAFEAGLIPPRMYVAIQCYWSVKTMLHLLDGDPRAALEASERHYTGPYTQIHLIRHLDYHFYRGLAVAALLDGKDPGSLRSVLVEHYEAIRQWAVQTGSPTFADKHVLLEAELARIDGRTLEAQALYEQAARLARQNGFLHCEAIAYETAARFYADLGLLRISNGCLRDAMEAYGRWGARGKVRQLLKAHPALGRPPYVSALSASMGPVPSMDVASVLGPPQPVASDLGGDRLVNVLMRNVMEQAGAQRAVLMFVHAQSLEVAAAARTTGDAVEVKLGGVSVGDAGVPHSVARFVMRTGEPVLVDNALEDSRFSSDDWVLSRGIRSVLCLPVTNHGKLHALLYMENNLAPRMFARSQVEVLTLLSLQAAMSLENVRLYEDLEAREAKLRRIFDLNVIGIVFWDLSGQLIDANDAFLRMVGRSRGELESGALRWYDMTPPEWQAQVPREVQELAETGALRPLQKEFFRKDGSRVPVLMGAATFAGKSDEGVAVIVDLSKQKEAEARAIDGERRNTMLQAELAHANRVATMGHLAAWIAHDVKQPLAGIVTSGDAALRWLSANPPNLAAASRAIERAVGDGMRAAAILDRTRAMVKRATPQAETVDVNWLIRDTLTLVWSEAQRKGIALKSELADGELLATADRVQLQQVVLNLLVNALEALASDDSQCGTVLVKSSLDPVDGVVVAVCDDGPGLPSGERCFEAFYTTKPEGLGMGLAICRSIVESFGGRIAAAALNPRGTQFRFSLPVAG